ncbi:hypothetical protein GIB67_016934 [Kingdonia uniflora]|uniref:Uncharacterized protein n=1 Tax=Kingdonia uniflora TaxID=39325 RepID=A0A7J7M3H9_9MAGN|nr:hypothetical protein GIB67_016934 [Kingdonia uniflora]
MFGVGALFFVTSADIALSFSPSTHVSSSTSTPMYIEDVFLYPGRPSQTVQSTRQQSTSSVYMPFLSPDTFSARHEKQGTEMDFRDKTFRSPTTGLVQTLYNLPPKYSPFAPLSTSYKLQSILCLQKYHPGERHLLSKLFGCMPPEGKVS